MLRQKHNQIFGGEKASRKCPKCHSNKIWKDGKRKTQNCNIQRYICRECDYRFSESAILSTQRYNNSERQICVTSTEGTKNLTTVETRTKNRLAGATVDTIKTTDFFKEFPSDIRFDVLMYAENRLKQGCTEKGVKSYLYCLRILIRNGANLNNPESVRTVIAKMKVSPRTKNNLCRVYDSFLKRIRKTWQKPKYVGSQKLPYVPLESEINLLIGGCSKTISTVLQTIKETGARIGEATRIRWDDVDFNRRVVSINYPEKGSLPRQIKVSEKLISMLNNIPRKRKTIFAKNLRYHTNTTNNENA